MFEGSGSDTDSLADTDTGLYILGIKYKTPNGKLSKDKTILLLFIYSNRYLCNS
jgi:hypothetical protein